ncbi:MAG: Heat-inducible transcription repressor HrcA [Calditrichaeota bacterium]|nr:Heat-inducible transcription repressor HrcA [Calditrichota bacterium]
MSESRSLARELTDRERTVFTALLHEYIMTARPVGSRILSKRLAMKLSPASVRNVMADLEELGLLVQPHTSAGRIPTTVGYGLYVDSLMKRVDLRHHERRAIVHALKEASLGGVTDVLDRTSETLARTSALIAVVLSPNLTEGILHKIDLVRIASGRLLVILSIRSGFVRSILLEISASLKDHEIEATTRLLNERLAGLTLDQVRRTIGERLRGAIASGKPLMKLVIDSADRIFREDRVGEIHLDGTSNVFGQPDFTDLDETRAVIEVLEDREVILHLLASGSHTPEEGLRISIGEEIGRDVLEGCSVIAASYSIGDIEGALGVIGPTRMNYAHLSSLVKFAAGEINQRMEN